MATFSFSATREQAESEFGLESGGSLKIKEGPNKIRLLSPTVGYQNVYKGEKKFRFACWVFDYADGKVKLYFMPMAVHRIIESLQLSEDYAFTEVPMPYDITINATNAGTKQVKYGITPARANTPLSETCVEQLAKKGDIVDVVNKLKEKEGGNQEQPTSTEDYSGGYTPAPNVGEVKLEDINF